MSNPKIQENDQVHPREGSHAEGSAGKLDERAWHRSVGGDLMNRLALLRLLPPSERPTGLQGVGD